MNKYEFLTELCARLQNLPEDDVRRSADYYVEMIDDRIEDGMTEEEAVASLGNIDEIAKSIIADSSAEPTPQVRAVPQKKRTWWVIVLLVLGFPVWGSLAIAVAAVVFSVWITLWSAVISLYAAAVSVAASAIGCLLASFFLFDIAGAVPVAIGTALVCAGLTILLFILSNLAAKGMVALTKLTWIGIRRIFTGKERAA